MAFKRTDSWADLPAAFAVEAQGIVHAYSPQDFGVAGLKAVNVLPKQSVRWVDGNGIIHEEYDPKDSKPVTPVVSSVV